MLSEIHAKPHRRPNLKALLRPHEGPWKKTSIYRRGDSSLHVDRTAETIRDRGETPPSIVGWNVRLLH